MKLKSLLLGSAATLALSTGAMAADAIPATFVSLGVCDALGITGLTIESDDTCLSISGEVSYEFTSEGEPWGWDSDVDWELAFEATTQTDAGAAVAYIGFTDDSDMGDDIVVDEAYVQFGDTTVLSAGLKDSIFDTSTNGYFDYNAATVNKGGHVIQIESLIADGFTVIAALEDLQNDGGNAGTAGLGIEFESGVVSAEAGFLYGGLLAGVNELDYYARVEAELDIATFEAGFSGNDTGAWFAELGAEATFDMFTLEAGVGFNDAGDYDVGAEATFAATDTIEVYVGAEYETIPAVDVLTVYGGVEAEVTETITVAAEVGYVDLMPGGDYIYGEAGVTYAPGGGFETSLEGGTDTTGDYFLTFEASKEF